MRWLHPQAMPGEERWRLAALLHPRQLLPGHDLCQVRCHANQHTAPAHAPPVCAAAAVLHALQHLHCLLDSILHHPIGR